MLPESKSNKCQNKVNNIHITVFTSVAIVTIIWGEKIAIFIKLVMPKLNSKVYQNLSKCYIKQYRNWMNLTLHARKEKAKADKIDLGHHLLQMAIVHMWTKSNQPEKSMNWYYTISSLSKGARLRQCFCLNWCSCVKSCITIRLHLIKIDWIIKQYPWSMQFALK